MTVQNAVDTYVACQQQQNVVVANDESGEDAAIDTFDLQGSQLTSALLTAGQTVTAITTACNRTYLDQHHTPYTTDKANYDSHINELHNIPNGMFAVLQAYETCESRVIAEEAAIAEAVRCFDISTNLPSVKNNS